MKYRKVVLVFVAVFSAMIFSSCGKESPSEFFEYSSYAGEESIAFKLARDTGLFDDEKNKIIIDDDTLNQIASDAAGAAEKAAAEFNEEKNEALKELNMPHRYVLDLPAELISRYETARRFSDLTSGAYEPVFGAVTALYESGIPSDEEISEALTHTGADKIVINGTDAEKADTAAAVDFGILGNGYVLEKLKEYFENSDVPYGMITYGGAAAVFGERAGNSPYRINNTVPSGNSEYSGSFLLKEGCLYSLHGSESVINPRTGKPSDTELTEICVYSPDILTAAIVAQAIAVDGIEGMNTLYSSSEIEFEAAVVDKNGELILTSGLSSETSEIYESAPVQTEKNH